MFALRVGTLPDGARLEPLLHHVRAAALGAFLGHGLAPGDERAVGIAVAAVERLALLGAALHDLALRALRALDADCLLLDVLAGGVIAARRELAEPAILHHQVVAALRALFVERRILLLRAADLFGGLAVGVSGAGQEGAEAALLQDHGAAAVFAVFLFALLGDFHILGFRFAGVGALGVAGASDELAVLAPFQHEGLAALAAHLTGGFFHPLDVGHVLFGVLQIFVEALVEVGHGNPPVEFALFDFVEFFFHPRGVLHLEDVVETLQQQAGHDDAQFRGRGAAAFLLDVLALQNRGEDGGVGGGPADAVGFQAFDQGGFVVTRRRLGEVLFGLDGLEAQQFALGHGRQAVLQFFVFFIGLILTFLVDLEIAVELGDAAGGAEGVLHGVFALGGDIDGGLIEQRGHHLAGHKAIPDQPVQLHLVFGQVLLHHFRRVSHGGGADGFVRVLRVLLALVNVGAWRQELDPVALADVVAEVGGLRVRVRAEDA